MYSKAINFKLNVHTKSYTYIRSLNRRGLFDWRKSETGSLEIVEVDVNDVCYNYKTLGQLCEAFGDMEDINSTKADFMSLLTIDWQPRGNAVDYINVTAKTLRAMYQLANEIAFLCRVQDDEFKTGNFADLMYSAKEMVMFTALISDRRNVHAGLFRDLVLSNKENGLNTPIGHIFSVTRKLYFGNLSKSEIARIPQDALEDFMDDASVKPDNMEHSHYIEMNRYKTARSMMPLLFLDCIFDFEKVHYSKSFSYFKNM